MAVNTNFVNFENAYPNYYCYLDNGKKVTITVVDAKNHVVKLYGVTGKELKRNGDYAFALAGQYKNDVASALANFLIYGDDTYWNYYLYVDSCVNAGIKSFGYYPIRDFLTGNIKISALVKLTRKHDKIEDFLDSVHTMLLHNSGFTDAEIEFFTKIKNNISAQQRDLFYNNKKARQLIMKMADAPETGVLGMYTMLNFIGNYCADCLELELEVSTDGNFWENCANIKERARLERERKENIIFAKKQTERNLFFENDYFFTIIPTSRTECREEGERLHNCLGDHEWNYFLRDGYRQVVFIRQKADPEKSFIACDIDGNTGTIIQYLTFCNRVVEDAGAQIFKRLYQEYLHEIYRKG